MNFQKSPLKRFKQRASAQIQLSKASLRLMQMIQDGKSENISEYLTSLKEETSFVNHVNNEIGLAPLHVAARSGDGRLVEQLIKYGASVHKAAVDGKQALHFAAKYHKETKANRYQSQTKLDKSTTESCIQVLLNNGAKVNAEDHFQTTALHLACERGNSQAVQVLLTANGISLKALNYRKMTPLHEAARHGHHQVVSDILNASNGVGDVIKLKDEKHCTPLMLASFGGHVKVCERILEFCQNLSQKEVVWQLLAKDADSCTSLHAAIESGSCETVRLILESWKTNQQHADDFSSDSLNPNASGQKYVDLRRSDGKTCLHLAGSEGNLEMVKMVLQHDASVNAGTEENETSLHFAALRNHADIISILLKSGGSCEICDDEGRTPLLTACQSGHVGATKRLLEHGANFLATDQLGRNCLMLATQSGNLATVQEILSVVGKSLITECDRHGNTALHIAAEKGMLSIAQTLLAKEVHLDKRNHNQHTPVLVASMNGRLSVVREIVSKHRPSLNHQDEHSRTALHLAALNGHAEVVSGLLDIGANIFHLDDKRQTSLDMSIIGGWVDCASVLLDTEEKLVDNKSRSGHTSLLLACKIGRPELVALLLKHNANVKDRLPDGCNALDVAIDNRNEGCALELVKHESWKESLRNATKCQDGEDYLLTPFRKLVENMPDVAEVVLTKSMVISEVGLEDENCEIRFDYEILDDEYEIPLWNIFGGKETEEDKRKTTANNLQSDGASGCESCSNDDPYGSNGQLTKDSQPYATRSAIVLDNHPLKFMVNFKRERLLRHPTVTSWINYKWRKFGRYIYWANLLTYLLYFVSFNTYMTTTPPRFAVNETDFHDCVRFRSEAQSLWGVDCLQFSSSRHFFTILIMSISSVQLLKKFTQLIHLRLKFFLNWINYMDVALYALSLLVLIDFESDEHDTDIRQVWQWECGAFAVLLSWFSLLLYIRRSKWLGIFVFMVGEVGVTFLRFAAIFVLFLLAFSLSFYVLLQNQIAFNTPAWACVQTFTMMLGELNYSDIFLSHFTSSIYSKIVQYQEATVFVFIVFCIVMNLLLTNLLVGLAVDDISAVHRQASLRRIALEVEGILDINYAAPAFLRRRWMVRDRMVMPSNKNEESHYFWSWFNREENLKPKVINEALTRDESDLEKMSSEIKDLKMDLNKIMCTLSNLSKGKIAATN